MKTESTKPKEAEPATPAWPGPPPREGSGKDERPPLRRRAGAAPPPPPKNRAAKRPVTLVSAPRPVLTVPFQTYRAPGLPGDRVEVLNADYKTIYMNERTGQASAHPPIFNHQRQAWEWPPLPFDQSVWKPRGRGAPHPQMPPHNDW